MTHSSIDGAAQNFMVELQCTDGSSIYMHNSGGWKIQKMVKKSWLSVKKM